MHHWLKASEQDIPEHKLCKKNIFSSLMESHDETQYIVWGLWLLLKHSIYEIHIFHPIWVLYEVEAFTIFFRFDNGPVSI